MDLNDATATVILLQSQEEGDDKSRIRKRGLAVSIFSCLHSYRRDIAIAMGPLSALLIILFVKIDADDSENKIAEMLAVVTWVCIWWVTEAVPTAITSLVPLFMFPVLQIMEADAVARSYMNDTITLFIGSFMLAIAAQKYEAHKRIALKTLLIFGGESMNPRMLLLGFCIGPAFISMWISNTATAVMMMPMSAGVLKRLLDPADISAAADEENAGNPALLRRMSSKAIVEEEEARTLDQSRVYAEAYARAVVLGIAFAVCIGGLTTLTGTGTNLVFLAIWRSCFPTAASVTYLQWFMFAFPLGLVMLAICWIMLCFYFCPSAGSSTISARLNRSSLEEELKSLGNMEFAESTVLGLFTALIVLWLTRCLGASSGWGVLFHNYADDGTISVFVAVFLFIIPNKVEPGEKLLNWSHCKKLPWDIVLLFGGGFALAAGFNSTGLSAWVTQYLDFLDQIPTLLIAPVVALLVGLITEFTSNNATATIFLPLLANAALSNKLHPSLLMITGTIAASFSFMLPISTPPMAIAFSTGHLRMSDMIVSGFLLKCAGIVLLFGLMPTLGTHVFHLDEPFLRTST